MAAYFKPTVEELLERNKEYAQNTHKALPTMMARMKNDPKANGPHVAIVSCFDSRANPFEFLNVQLRECLVLRNVGGRFSTAAEQIAALDIVFHVSQLIIIHHSNCGTSHATMQQGLDGVAAKRPDFKDGEELKKRLPFKKDDWEALVEDLKLVKRNGFLRRDLIEGVVGLWLDVETGLVRRVGVDGVVGEE